MHSRRQTGTLVIVIRAALSSPSTKRWGGPQEGKIFLTGRVRLDREEHWAWPLEVQDDFHWQSRGEGPDIEGPGAMTHPTSGKRPLPCQGQQELCLSILHGPCVSQYPLQAHAQGYHLPPSAFRCVVWVQKFLEREKATPRSHLTPSPFRSCFSGHKAWTQEQGALPRSVVAINCWPGIKSSFRLTALRNRTEHRTVCILLVAKSEAGRWDISNKDLNSKCLCTPDSLDAKLPSAKYTLVPLGLPWEGPPNSSAVTSLGGLKGQMPSPSTLYLNKPSLLLSYWSHNGSFSSVPANLAHYLFFKIKFYW